MAARRDTMNNFTRYFLITFYTLAGAYLALWIGAWWYVVMVAQ